MQHGIWSQTVCFQKDSDTQVAIMSNMNKGIGKEGYTVVIFVDPKKR